MCWRKMKAGPGHDEMLFQTGRHVDDLSCLELHKQAGFRVECVMMTGLSALKEHLEDEVYSRNRGESCPGTLGPTLGRD